MGPPYPSELPLNYALDKLQTQLNNTFGTSFYQPYNGQVNAQPGLGNATEIRISDVMDDRHIVGGYTIPVNLSNTFFGLAFLNLEGQVDKEISFQRQSSARIDAGTGQLVETATHLLRREWRWAFDEVRSLRWGLAARFNRDVIQGTDLFSLTADNNTGEQLGLQVAWVHDDTRSPRLNIHHGSVPGCGPSISSTAWARRPRRQRTDHPGTGMVVWHGRLRRPQVHSPGGAQHPCVAHGRRLVHWPKEIAPHARRHGQQLSLAGNANTPVDPDIPYTYQARITPLAGIPKQRAQRANVAVANAEIRFPFFFNSAGKSDFLKHLQAVAFADVGAAWTGCIPTPTTTPSTSSPWRPTPSRSP